MQIFQSSQRFMEAQIILKSVYKMSIFYLIAVLPILRFA